MDEEENIKKGAIPKKRYGISPKWKEKFMKPAGFSGHYQNKEPRAICTRLLEDHEPDQTMRRGRFPIKSMDYGGHYPNNYKPKATDKNNKPFSGPHKFKMGFKYVEEMSKKDSNDLLMELFKKKIEFSKLTQTELTPDFYVLIISIMGKLCQSNFQEMSCSIISNLCQNQFINKLRLYISDIALQDAYEKSQNTYFWKNPEQFFDNVFIFCNTVLVRLPITACEILPKVLMSMGLAINNIEKQHNVTFSDDIKKKFEDLQYKLTLIIDEKIKKEQKDPMNKVTEKGPPNDFRSISIYPTIEEITIPNKPFIRPNIIDGSYTSVEHYLDIQFRLLREDFIAPLREGILDYLNQIKEGQKRKRLFNIRIHHKVQFVKKILTQDQVCTLVQLNKKHKFKIVNSKRFMYGSLLCFTRDGFKSTVFGTIVDNDPKLLSLNQIAVDLLDQVTFNSDYIMVECNVFFEPYYHVLTALQNMNENNFPFKKYILDVQCTKALPPYLQHEDREIPTALELCLDDSQYRAFQSAVLQELSVIQGPPGTGKTYIGLKVVQHLLQNTGFNRPILVICYTNHALDQFLEGILEFEESVVRVGGQSKNLKVNSRNIKALRQKNKMFWITKKDLNYCMQRIKLIQDQLNTLHSLEGVLDFDHFVAMDENIRNTWFCKCNQNQLINWFFRENKKDTGTSKRFQLQQSQFTTEAQNYEKENLDFYNEYFYDSQDKMLDLDGWYLNSLHKTTYSISLGSVDKMILYLQEQINNENNFNEFTAYHINMEIKKMIALRSNLLYLLETYNSGQYKVLDIPFSEISRYNLTINERWAFYFNLLDKFKNYLTRLLKQLFREYKHLNIEYEETRMLVDSQIMKCEKIIGMTTTGAAKYQNTLRELKCPIVIVEEAAEVLEAHIIVALTEKCQQLILIGDHKQLRPTTSEYRLAKKFNLEISLFERMLKNGVHCELLDVQHRMRPEIVKLLVPTIYPTLKNHMSVDYYPDVLGVKSNLFFITHNEFEEEDEDLSTHKNIHEAKFIIKLARHLILQGYNARDITILTTYTGQMYELWKLKKEESLLQNIAITVVDNFQGEENQIILLSLVRSNADANIGFLKTENRVCVALSRAKEGLFIIGNMGNLEQNNELWPKIKQELIDQDSFGTHLVLRCQQHPNHYTPVASAEDFEKVSEGGCSQLCNYLMDCNHTCQSLCHIFRNDHKMNCKQPCSRVCKNDHPCKELCYQPCVCHQLMTYNLPCGHTASIPCYKDPDEYICGVNVEVVLDCGHKNIKQCGANIDQVACDHPCEIRMPCGHSCVGKCHFKDPDHIDVKCNKPCELMRKKCSTGEHKCPLLCHENCSLCVMQISKKHKNCKHSVLIACSEDPDTKLCMEPCARLMKCGHACKLKCKEMCGNCKVKVTKIIPECGHSVKIQCKDIPTRAMCIKKCSLLLPCGHPCVQNCSEKCTIFCRFMVKNPHLAACGHDFNIPCYKTKQEFEPMSLDLLKHCTHPCKTSLSCEHICSGTCGQCMQGRVHLPCKEKCGALLLCGHPCEVPCRKGCQPCTRKCEFKCPHSNCGKQCGVPCVSCQEPCTRKCQHNECTRKCGEICNSPPCSEPCDKILNCGHKCIGFCGDPCPPVCRICNSDHETFQVFFGKEDELDSRFVLLADCGHVVENSQTEGYLQSLTENNSKEITMIKCPRCSTPIVKTIRYSDYVKTTFQDIIAIKVKTFGNRKENNQKWTKLLNMIEECPKILLEDLQNDILSCMKKIFQSNNKKMQTNQSAMFINSFTIRVEILKKLSELYSKAPKFTKKTYAEKTLIQFNALIKYLHPDKELTEQLVTDMNLEMHRFDRMIQLFKVQDGLHGIEINSIERTQLQNVCNIILSTNRYDLSKDSSVIQDLAKLGDIIDITINSAEFRKQIVAAMGLTKGHWFKCPNGHYYAIGDCGGANQISKCADCGELIGGSHHLLLPTNRHAREMDQSQYPAWSEQANLNNYHF